MFEENNLNQDTVYGVARSRNTNYYKPHDSDCNRIDLQHFIQDECAIDMLLDATNGSLRMCVVGMCNEEKEVKINNMPTTKTEGWTHGWSPHFVCNILLYFNDDNIYRDP